MNGGDILLEACGLSVSIGGHTACATLDFRLRAGQRLAILGRNGAGKSTLLSVLSGLRPPQGGQVLLAGDDLATLPPREAAQRRGWLGQHHGDPFAASVLETVLTGRHPHLGRWHWESGTDLAIAHDALRVMGLSELEARGTHQLSGGEWQRVALATLLAQQPRLFLLDEPLAHLDLNHQIAVLECFTAKVREEGVATVMVLHDPGLALRYSDCVLLMFGDGRCEFGQSSELLDAERLSLLYGHPLLRVEADGRAAFVPR